MRRRPVGIEETVKTVRKSIITAVLAGAAALAVTACTPYDEPSTMPSTPDLPTGVAPVQSTGGASAQASGQHNDADVAFAQGLYTQRAYAVQLAGLVTAQGGSKQVADIAKRMQDADQQDIAQLGTWLSAWGASAPSTSQNSGETSAQTLAQLKQLHGADFDKQWLQAMLSQHTSELALAGTEQSSGANPDAKAYAQRVTATDQQDIQQLSSLLGH